MGGYTAVLFDLFGTLVWDDGRAVDGARELLSALPPERWGIVTSCSARLASALLREAGLPEPSVLVSADEVARNKPAPDGYLRAAEHLGTAPSQALAVEDSPQGIAAARAAGMDVVAVLRGRGSDFASQATYLVPALANLSLVLSGDGLIHPEVRR